MKLMSPLKYRRPNKKSFHYRIAPRKSLPPGRADFCRLIVGRGRLIWREIL